MGVECGEGLVSTAFAGLIVRTPGRMRAHPLLACHRHVCPPSPAPRSVQRSPNWSEVPEGDRVGQPGAAARLAPAAVAHGLWIEGGSGGAAAQAPVPHAEQTGDEDEF